MVLVGSQVFAPTSPGAGRFLDADFFEDPGVAAAAFFDDPGVAAAAFFDDPGVAAAAFFDDPGVAAAAFSLTGGASSW